jgi:hypothetical protein
LRRPKHFLLLSFSHLHSLLFVVFPSITHSDTTPSTLNERWERATAAYGRGLGADPIWNSTTSVLNSSSDKVQQNLERNLAAVLQGADQPEPKGWTDFFSKSQ